MKRYEAWLWRATVVAVLAVGSAVVLLVNVWNGNLDL